MNQYINQPLSERVIWEPVFVQNESGQYGLHIRPTKTGDAIGSLIINAVEEHPTLGRVLQAYEDTMTESLRLGDEDFIPIDDPTILIEGLAHYIQVSASARMPFTRVGEKDGHKIASLFMKGDERFVTNGDVAKQILSEIDFCLDPLQQWD